MKNYRQLVESLPPKTIVFAFGRFNPPTTGHELLVKTVKKLAEKNKAQHVIYASKTQNAKKDPLSVDKKLHYLNILFPSTNFVGADDNIRTFMEAAKHLNSKYKNLIMVAGSDRVPEFQKILNAYNGKDYNYDSIQVISAGERDPDSDSATGMSATKMRGAAAKGNYVDFKKGLPSHVRDIDGKLLMNDVRVGLGLEAIKEQVRFSVDSIREEYFKGSILLEGQLVESEGLQYTIIKRGANHLLLEDAEGNKVSKWIKDVTLVEDIQPGPIPDEITFHGYKTKNLHHSEDAIRAFGETIKRLGDTHIEDILHALKATDTYMKINDYHLEQGVPPDQKDLSIWRAAHAEARLHLAKMGEFMHHMDYWHMHEHEIQDMEGNYTLSTAGAEMNEELSTKTIKPTDKLKVARMIASFLGNEDAEKSSNAENLVNSALRKVKSKITHAESQAMLTKMLTLADEVGINYDKALLPGKMKEAHEPRVAPIDTKSKRNAGNDILSIKDFTKLSKLNKGILPEACACTDTKDDTEELKLVNPEGEIVNPQNIQHTKVGSSLTYPENDTNRRMKVRYKTEEVDLTEISTATAKDVHAARVDQYNKAKKSGDAEATEKAKGKMKTSFKHYLNKDKKDNAKLYAKQPKDVEGIKKAANAEYEYNKSRGLSNEEVDLDEAVTQPNGTDAVMPRGSTVEVSKKLKKSPVKNDDQQIGVNNAHGFDAFFSEEADELSDDDMNSMVDSIKDENDILDAYDDDELSIIDSETGEELHSTIKEEIEAINEVLSRAERIKAKIRFARSESKRERKIQVALKRHSDTKTINNRARKLAISLMKKRLAKKPLDKLSVAEKERIEAIIAKRKTGVDRLAMKLTARVRKIENDRLAHHKYTKA